MPHSTDVGHFYDRKTLQYTSQCCKPKPFTDNNNNNVNLQQLLIGFDWEDEVPFTEPPGITIAPNNSESDSDGESTSITTVIPITLSFTAQDIHQQIKFNTITPTRNEIKSLFDNRTDEYIYHPPILKFDSHFPNTHVDLFDCSPQPINSPRAQVHH